MLKVETNGIFMKILKHIACQDKNSSICLAVGLSHVAGSRSQKQDSFWAAVEATDASSDPVCQDRCESPTSSHPAKPEILCDRIHCLVLNQISQKKIRRPWLWA